MQGFVSPAHVSLLSSRVTWQPGSSACVSRVLPGDPRGESHALLRPFYCVNEDVGVQRGDRAYPPLSPGQTGDRGSTRLVAPHPVSGDRRGSGVNTWNEALAKSGESRFWIPEAGRGAQRGNEQTQFTNLASSEPFIH